MGEIFQQAISLTGTFNLWLILTIFAITMVAEFGFTIPYLLETIWLLIGYHVIGGTISPGSIMIFCVISLIGREIGAGALYKISGYGRGPLLRILYKLIEINPKSKPPIRFLKQKVTFPVINIVSKLMVPQSSIHNVRLGQAPVKNKTFCPSTFNVFLGRFSWLKIPITVNLGVVKKPARLILGVGLFSLAWDGLYIILGTVGAGNKINSVLMLACTISTFLLINATVYFIRRHRASRRLASAG